MSSRRRPDVEDLLDASGWLRALRVTDEAAEAVTQLAERTEVIDKAMEDPAFRRAVRDAHHDRGIRIEAENRSSTPQGPPNVAAPRPHTAQAPPAVPHQETPAAVLRILGQCTSFCVTMQNAVVAAQEELLTTEQKTAVLDSLGKVRAICDWCEHAVTTGRSDMDEDLARLLNNEGGDPS